MESEGFYLAGGTAVALHLGHRRSADLDWFTERPVGDFLLLGSRLHALGIPLAVEAVAPGTLQGRLHGVRASFFEYRYQLLAALAPRPECGCALASLDDLACMKLSAIAQRGAKKDFIDLYALASTYRPLRELLDAYQGKYGILDIGHVIYGLTYFDTADRERTPPLLWNIDWRTAKRAIRGWVHQLL
jgi:hypothetical protein